MENAYRIQTETFEGDSIMFDENGKILTKDFPITIKDAKRLVDSLEFTADFDKTKIYYKLKSWVDEVEQK